MSHDAADTADPAGGAAGSPRAPRAGAADDRCTRLENRHACPCAARTLRLPAEHALRMRCAAAPLRATGGRSRAIARNGRSLASHRANTHCCLCSSRAKQQKSRPTNDPIPSPTGAWWNMAGRRKEMKVTLHLQPPTWGMPTCHPDFLQVASGVHVVLVVRQHARLLARFLNRLWPAARPPTGAKKAADRVRTRRC